MMNNTEKKLDALIDALGFDVEVIETITLSGKPLEKPDMTPGAFLPVEASDLRDIIRVIDYKLTKRKVNGKSELHRIVREYESGHRSIGDMLNEIAKIEGMLNHL
jgi:hypothetical protein